MIIKDMPYMPLSPDGSLVLIVDPLPHLVTEMDEEEKARISLRLNHVCDVAERLRIVTLETSAGISP